MSTHRERRMEQKRGEISVTFQALELLHELAPYLQGDADENHEGPYTIEQLVALVMGWNFRAIQIPRKPAEFAQVVRSELIRRVGRLDPLTPPDQAEREARRMNRGGSMSAGRVLIQHDLDEDTLFLMWKRIERVHRLISTLSGGDEEESLMRMFSRTKMASDELLIDTYVYFWLHEPDVDGRVKALGVEPEWALEFLDEMSRDLRKQGEWTDDQGNPVDQDVIDDLATHFPGEYEAHKKVSHLTKAHIPERNDAVSRYRRKNNVSTFDTFWTEDRIRAFISMEAHVSSFDNPETPGEH